MNDLSITLRFIKNISLNPLQYISWALLVLSMIVLLSFNEMVSSYESYFIEKLRSVYPNVFLYTSNKKLEPLEENVTHEKEIFEIIWSKFEYSYDKVQGQTTANISLRSFSKEHIPPVLQQYETEIANEENTIYINREFYTKLVLHSDYKDGLYLKSYKDNSYHFFHIKPFDMHDETEWILIPNYLAHELFYNSMFGYSVVYSDKLSEEELYELYSSKYKYVFLWRDKVPLFSRASIAILENAFQVVLFTTTILIITTIFVMLKSIIDEYILFTTLAMRYGVNLWRLGMVFISFLFLYISSILGLSYSVAYYIKSIVAKVVQGLPLEMLTSLNALIIFAFVSSVVIVVGLFKYVEKSMRKRVFT